MKKTAIILFLSLLVYAAKGQTCIPDNDSGVEIRYFTSRFEYGNAIINPMYIFYATHMQDSNELPIKLYVYDTITNEPMSTYRTLHKASFENTYICHSSDCGVWTIAIDNHMGLESLEGTIDNIGMTYKTDLVSFLKESKAACKARISDITIVELH